MAISIERLTGAINATHDTGPLQENFLLIDNSTGDLAGKDHQEILDTINYCAALSIADARRNGFQLPENVTTLVNSLKTGQENYRQYVENPLNYEPYAAQRIIERYQRVDEQTKGFSPRDRMIARIQSGKGLIFVTDMDGTLTNDPDEYLMHIPGSGRNGSGLAEDLLGELGRDEFAKVFAHVWQPILRDAPDIFRAAGRSAEPLPGTQELFTYLHKKGIPTHIDSANFLPVVDEFVKTYLPKINGDIQIWAITQNSILSTDKGNVLQDIALTYPDHTVVHTGDSTSDEASLKAEPYVGGYFARAGLGFERVLQKKGSLYIPYTDHYDTLSLIREAERTRQENI